MKGYIKPAVIACCIVVGLACAASAAEIEPVMVSNRALGGADLNSYTLGVAGGRGANNVGLLVRTWGKVTYVNTAEQYFYVDDGSRLTDGTRRPDDSIVFGVRVSYAELAPGVAVNPPSENVDVAVTGISSTVVLSSLTYPNLRVRKQADVVSFP